jgi:hypothetical protein
MRYQLRKYWLGREDSNLRMAESLAYRRFHLKALARSSAADRNVAGDDHDCDRRADVSERDRTITKTTNSTVAAASPDSDRDLIARQVERIILRPRAIEITISDKQDERDDASRATAGDERGFFQQRR